MNKWSQGHPRSERAAAERTHQLHGLQPGPAGFLLPGGARLSDEGPLVNACCPKLFPQLSVCLPRLFRRVIPPDLAAYGEGWVICVSQIRPENIRSRALQASSAALLMGFLFQSHPPAF